MLGLAAAEHSKTWQRDILTNISAANTSYLTTLASRLYVNKQLY